MSNWKLRGCPRCRGDVYIENDNDEINERCLQCGYVKQISGACATAGAGKTGNQSLEEKRKVVSSVN
ncbi:MAG: hypothetical protein JW915_04500 [Chitinispirillaceae bacterium]|nr:hypothetical protein [Chitinispirillaceae bacterium]